MINNLNELITLCKKVVKPGLMYESVYEDNKVKVVITDHEDGLKELYIFKKGVKVNIGDKKAQEYMKCIFNITQQEDCSRVIEHLKGVVGDKTNT